MPLGENDSMSTEICDPGVLVMPTTSIVRSTSCFDVISPLELLILFTHITTVLCHSVRVCFGCCPVCFFQSLSDLVTFHLLGYPFSFCLIFFRLLFLFLSRYICTM